MCSTRPPPHGITHCRCVTNQATAECRIFGSIQDSSRRIVSFSSNKLDGWDRYTRDFKYPHSQKSIGVRSEDRGGHENLQHLLMFLSFSKVYIKNSLIGLTVEQLVVQSCINVTISNASFSRKHETTFSCKSFK